MSTTATTARAKWGVLGISAKKIRAAPAVIMARGWAANCLITSVLRLPSDTERVTIMPVAVEIIKAGSWDTRPSPMVTMEYWVSTVLMSMPPCTMPMIMPPIKLNPVISRDITASPLTILVAPSMAP